MAEGHWHDAERLCKEALEIAHQDPRFESLLGCTILGISIFLWKDALPHLETAVTLDPEYLDARAGRGRIRAHEDDYVGAMADVNAVLGSAPGHIEALLGRGNAQLERAKVFDDKGLPKAAPIDLSKAQLHSSNDFETGEALTGSAWALYARRNPFMECEIGQLAAVRPEHPHLRALRNAFQSLRPITVVDLNRRGGSASASRWDGSANYRRHTTQLMNTLTQNSMQWQHQSFLDQQEERRREDYRW